ncbi:MAG: hypothetical protein HPY50_00740 [Firmicutes bacterium]|nr:hypothetical protein [Bacillota bacterium]
MKETLDRLKPEMLQMQKLLRGEAEVLRHMSCEQCLLKSRAEKLEKAADRLKFWIEALGN